MRIITIKTTSLRAEQSILTGEGQPPLKTTDVVQIPEASLLDKRNILFSGTLVANGTAIGIAISTGTYPTHPTNCIGMNTEIGKIQKVLEGIEDEETPLKKRLEEFGETLAKG